MIKNTSGFIPILFLVVILCACNSTDKKGMQNFYGEWVVDFDRTMEEAKKSPKYSEEDLQKIPDIIKRMMGSMEVQITESEFLFKRGNKSISNTYELVEESENSAQALFTVNGREYFTDFILIENKFKRREL